MVSKKTNNKTYKYILALYFSSVSLGDTKLYKVIFIIKCNVVFRIFMVVIYIYHNTTKRKEKEQLYTSNISISHWDEDSMILKLMISLRATIKEILQKDVVKRSLKKFICYPRKYSLNEKKQ